MNIALFGIGEVSMIVVWLVIAVILAVIEAFTQGLTTIWFAGGAVVAAAAAVVTDSILLQFLAGLVVSIVLLYFTRPLAVKKFNRELVRTNISAVIGQTGIAESVLTPQEPGTVRADNKLWTAVLSPGEANVQRGEQVEILSVEGVKLIVRKKGDGSSAARSGLQKSGAGERL